MQNPIRTVSQNDHGSSLRMYTRNFPMLRPVRIAYRQLSPGGLLLALRRSDGLGIVALSLECRARMAPAPGIRENPERGRLVRVSPEKDPTGRREYLEGAGEIEHLDVVEQTDANCDGHW